MITSSSTAILLDSIIKDKETKVLKSFGNHSQDPQTPKWQNQLFSMIPSRALIFISTPDLLGNPAVFSFPSSYGKGHIILPCKYYWPAQLERREQFLIHTSVSQGPQMWGLHLWSSAIIASERHLGASRNSATLFLRQISSWGKRGLGEITPLYWKDSPGTWRKWSRWLCLTLWGSRCLDISLHRKLAWYVEIVGSRDPPWLVGLHAPFRDWKN